MQRLHAGVRGERWAAAGAAGGRRKGYDERRWDSDRVRALMAAIGVTLGISGAAADDLVGSAQIGAGDADEATSMATGGSGRVLWSRQPGTSIDDFASGVATDTNGNVYVVGDTLGALGGPTRDSSTRG